MVLLPMKRLNKILDQFYKPLVRSQLKNSLDLCKFLRLCTTKRKFEEFLHSLYIMSSIPAEKDLITVFRFVKSVVRRYEKVQVKGERGAVRCERLLLSSVGHSINKIVDKF